MHLHMLSVSLHFMRFWHFFCVVSNFFFFEIFFSQTFFTSFKLFVESRHFNSQLFWRFQHFSPIYWHNFAFIWKIKHKKRVFCSFYSQIEMQAFWSNDVRSVRAWIWTQLFFPLLDVGLFKCLDLNGCTLVYVCLSLRLMHKYLRNK